MYAQFVHSALADEGGGVQLVYESICCLAWGVIFDRKKDRGVVCVFSISNAGGSVCVCMCVYTHTHTHTAQIGYTVVSPSEGNNFSESLGPKWFELINQLQPREARFQKTARSAVFLLAVTAAKFLKLDISSASERAFPGVFGDVFGCSTPSKKRCFSTQEFTRFLSMVSLQRRAMRSDVSFQTT